MSSSKEVNPRPDQVLRELEKKVGKKLKLSKKLKNAIFEAAKERIEKGEKYFCNGDEWCVLCDTPLDICPECDAMDCWITEDHY